MRIEERKYREERRREGKRRKSEKRENKNREEKRNAVSSSSVKIRLIPWFSPALRFKGEVTVCGLVKGIWLTLWIQSGLQNRNLKNESSTHSEERRRDRRPHPERSLVFKPTLQMKTLECGEKFCCEESWPSLGSSSLTRRWTNDAQIITTVTGRYTAKLSNTPYTILETIFNKYILWINNKHVFVY